MRVSTAPLTWYNHYDIGTVMDGKVLCVGFSWDEYLIAEPLIDEAYRNYKG